MTLTWPIGLLVLAISAALYIVGRGIARQRMRPRETDIVRIFEQTVRPAGVTFDTYRAVTECLRSAYGVSPVSLMPDDRLQRLIELDSWDLGHGTERFEDLLVERFGPVPLPPASSTFLDLLLTIQRHRNRRHPDDRSE